MRRLSRIYPVEIPYRIAGILRSGAQSKGWFSATSVPAHAEDAQFGNPWVRSPASAASTVGDILCAADRLLSKGVIVFDMVVPIVNGSPQWNRDPKTGREIPRTFGLHIDFRHMAGDVDIKYLWELNRHLWWVTLAQAYAVSGQYKYLRALLRLLDNWLSECPYPLGPN